MHAELARWPSFSHQPTGEVSQGDAYSYASFDAFGTAVRTPRRPRTHDPVVTSAVISSGITPHHPHLQVMLA